VGDFSTHRATQEQGPSVVNGRLVWTSATGITTADPQSFGGCYRKWYFDHILGLKAPATKAMRAGTELHSEIERRLLTGANLQSPLALAGGIFVPHPGSGLFVEKPIHFTTKSGVAIYGHVDLYNLRQQYIDPEGTLQQDPPWSFEVKDWKTTSDFNYAKTERELAQNIQLVTYAEAGFRMWPDFEHARLTHAYFRTRGRPDAKLVTIRRSREEIALRWDYAESVVRTMSDIVQAPSVDHVDANTKSCSAYNGCPHAVRCSAYRRTSLDAVYGRIAEDWNRPTAQNVLPAQLERTAQMGLLSSNPQLMQNAPQQQAQQPQPDMRAQLQAEEAAMRQQVAQQQQQMPQQLNTAQLADACQRLGAFGFGFPALGANAAQAYALMGGQQIPPGFVYQGIMAPPGARRSLHTVELKEVAHIYQLLSELEAERGTQGPQIMPGVVDASRQYAQAQPTAQQAVNFATLTKEPTPPGGQYVQPVMYNPETGRMEPVAQGTPYQPAVAGGILPPGAPESRPELAMQQPTAPAFDATAHAASALVQAQQHTNEMTPVLEQATPVKKKSPGRPKKSQDTAPEAAGSPQPATTAATTPTPTPSTPAQAAATQGTPAAGSASSYALQLDAEHFKPEPRASDSGIVLVNARFANRSTKSLAGYVDYINAELSKRYSVTSDGKPGIQDVRCVPKDSPLSFNGWKGAVREVVKADPPPPDAYHLDTFHDELKEIVADALRVVAEQRGWLYVRGMVG